LNVRLKTGLLLTAIMNVNIRQSYCVVLACLVFCLYGCETQTNNKVEMPEQNTGLLQSNVEKNWGVQICGIRLSAADYMLDFRYRVIDPNKASPILNRQVKAYLIDEQSGAKLIVPTPPKVGSLRQKSYEPTADKIYFVMFSNPGRLVKRGSKVTVVIDEFKAENLVVE
jgi:hypothetical protein